MSDEQILPALQRSAYEEDTIESVYNHLTRLKLEMGATIRRMRELRPRVVAAEHDAKKAYRQRFLQLKAEEVIDPLQKRTDMLRKIQAEEDCADIALMAELLKSQLDSEQDWIDGLRKAIKTTNDLLWTLREERKIEMRID